MVTTYYSIDAPVGVEPLDHSVNIIGDNIYVFRRWVYHNSFIFTDEDVIVTADQTNQKWAGDNIYIWTREGSLSGCGPRSTFMTGDWTVYQTSGEAGLGDLGLDHGHRLQVTAEGLHPSRGSQQPMLLV